MGISHAFMSSRGHCAKPEIDRGRPLFQSSEPHHRHAKENVVCFCPKQSSLSKKGSYLIIWDNALFGHCLVAMRDTLTLRESLLKYLTDKGIRYSLDPGGRMKEKAVVEFPFDLEKIPVIRCGPFEDRSREIISIAHEAGHVLIYKGMNRDEARTYLCTMFAMHGIGLPEISSSGQEFILNVEAGASSNGFTILKEIGVVPTGMKSVKALMAKWYASYEALCDKKVVERVRDRIRADETASFLLL